MNCSISGILPISFILLLVIRNSIPSLVDMLYIIYNNKDSNSAYLNIFLFYINLMYVSADKFLKNN